MQLVILAAGEGRRMRPLTVDTPKCLLRAGRETMLGRLTRQFAEYRDIDSISVVIGHSADRVAAATRQYRGPIKLVRNPDFRADGNVGSAQLALRTIDMSRPLILLEANLWLDDRAVLRMIQAARAGRTELFTTGPFDPPMSGLILRHDADSKVDHLLHATIWTPALASYRKVLGSLVLGAADLASYAADIAALPDSNQPQSFVAPLSEHPTRWGPSACDLGDLHTAAIDTAADYQELLDHLRREAVAADTSVSLVPTDWLRPIEASTPERVTALTERIYAEAIWHTALVVDGRDFTVLDGHHRLEVARRQGLRRVPVVLLDLESVPAWDPGTGCPIPPHEIRERALAGSPYACGTLKLALPHLDLSCRYVIARLAA